MRCVDRPQLNDNLENGTMKNVKVNTTVPGYPVLTFASSHGKTLPPLFALAAFALGVWLSYRTAAADFAVVGLIAGIAIHFLPRGALELIELVVELLIPR